MRTSKNRNSVFTATIGGREVEFQPLWRDDETLSHVAILAGHELSDIEILWWARAYLDGPFTDVILPDPDETYMDHLGHMEESDTWPSFWDDTARWVHRVWARWDGREFRWVESTRPEGYRPAALVCLGGWP